MFVIDASVTMALCFEDEGGAAAEVVLTRLEHETAVAPAHWPLEVANALRSAERRGRLLAVDLPRLRGLLGALPVEVVSVELAAATGDVLETARAFDLSVYDAAYLGLAAFRGLPLATADERLRRACLRAGVELAA
jgi:predicted nucleic acid-binding protein